MPLTLRHLVSTPDLGLRLLTAETMLDRAITWVHVSELRDPTPFLSGGELLLTTGIGFDVPSRAVGAAVDDAAVDATAQQAADSYVQRLSAASVVGLGFGTGLSHDTVPAELVAAGHRYGLPIVEVPRQTPFIAISRAVSRAIAADEYAAVSKTFTAQQALTKAALAGGGPDRLIRLLAQQLSCWVALLDPSGAPIAASDQAKARQPALAAEVAMLAAHRGTVSAAFELPAGSTRDIVSLQSVGAGQRGRAFLAVGRAGPLSAGDRHLVNAAVMLLTIRLEQSSTSDSGLGRLRSALLGLVLAGQSELARPIAEQLSTPLPAEPITVLVLTGAVTGGADLLDGTGLLSPLAGQVLAAEADDAVVLLLNGGPDAATDTAARIVAGSAEIGDDEPAMAIGISPPTGYDDITRAHRQAGQAADFGRRRGQAITRFVDIAMPGLTGLLDPEQANAFAESLLGPLIEHDRSRRGDLLVSLRTWLAHHGQWDPSAAALGVHRHTLRHRMNTVEELIGRSLDAPGTRSELWLALEVLDRS